MRKVKPENIKLDPYEQEIEDNLEKAKRVENFEEWKKLVKRAATDTVNELEKKKIRLTLEVSSPALKEEVIRFLKERFGKNLKVVKV